MIRRILFRKQTSTTTQAYYRIEVPARVLMRRDPDLSLHIAAEWECRTEEELNMYYQAAMSMDAIVYFAIGGPVVDVIQRMLRATEGRRGIYVTDLDDNIDYVHPLNTRFGKLGTRMPDGTSLRELLKHSPGERYIRVPLPDGTFVKAWEDGVGDFNIRNNLKGIRALNRALRRADLATFTTDRLGAYYAEVQHLKHVYAFPNSVLFEDYPDFEVTRKEPGTVRVMWQGGSSHYTDLYPLRETLRIASERFPEIRWIVWGGQKFQWAWEDIPERMIEFHDVVPYSAYRLKLATMDFDIALCPLVDNVFNRGKSCIKWYEAAALNPPKPCLVSQVPPYTDEIPEGGCVWFDMPKNTEEVSESFLEGLEALIRDAKRRDATAARAREWIQEHRDAEKTVPAWIARMEERWGEVNE